jgi:Glyoxalase-like domain
MKKGISRRGFLITAGAALVAQRISVAAAVPKVPKLLDHILLGCNDLQRGIDFVYEHTGVRAVFGGVHPGNGTQNALLSLGTNRYLEIIAPDPKQPASADTRNLRTLDDDPTLVGWAAHQANIDAFAAHLKQQGFDIEGPLPGSRKRPDGRVLTWKVMRLKQDPTQLLPFFIEWSADSIHPSIDSPQGCQLFLFEAFSPYADARAITDQVKALGLDLPLAPGKKSYLAATIIGPKGELKVTS